MTRRKITVPPTKALARIKGLMFDLDGTLLLSDRSLGGYDILPGAVQVLTEITRRGLPFVILTNGSAYPPAQQAAKLRGYGLPVPDERMLTPSSVAADLMTRHGVKRCCPAPASDCRRRAWRRSSPASPATGTCRPSTSAGIRTAR
jgi:ribonucleotide monophosphatase NagD (HAD superfamily)